MLQIALVLLVSIYLLLKFRPLIKLLLLQVCRIIVELLLVGFSTGVVFILITCLIKLSGK